MPFQLVTNEGKRISLLNGGDAARAGGYARYDQYPLGGPTGPQTVGQPGGYMPPPPPSLMDSSQYYTTSMAPPLYATTAPSGQGTGQNPTPRTANTVPTNPPGGGQASMYGMAATQPSVQNPYAYYYTTGGGGPTLYAAAAPPPPMGMYGGPGGGPSIKDLGYDQAAGVVTPVSHVAAKPVKKYTCHCMRSFTTSGHLARHMRIHTGEKNYKCPHEGCGARFSRQDNCMQHYRTHLGGRGRGNSRSNRGSGSGASGGSRGTGGAGRNNSASSQGSAGGAGISGMAPQGGSAGPITGANVHQNSQNALQAFAGVASMQTVQ
jgi:hypothetical protein